MSSRPRVSSTCYLCMILLTVVIIFAVDNGAAKRGCALFGHSCYGGHGKRSFQVPQQLESYWPSTNHKNTQQYEDDDDEDNMNFQMKLTSQQFTPFWKKWILLYNKRNMNNPGNNNNM